MLSFRPKGGISDSANDRDVSTSLRFARHDRTTFILSTYLPKQSVGGIAIAVLNHGLGPFLLAPGVPWT